jgi:hypothetical protein
MPIADPLMIAEPKFWGFFILPIDYGYSWSWAWKAFATFTSLFLLLLVLTRGDTFIAVVGALWIYGSSFMQWWFSNGLPEIVCGSSLAILGALYMLRAEKIGGILFGSMLVTFAVPNLLIYLYPPFQFPLLCMAIVIVIGLLIEQRGWSFALDQSRSRLMASAVVLVMVGLFAYRFISEGLPTMQLVLDTVYPGRRVALGGEVHAYRLFDGLFEGFRSGQNNFPLKPTNASEAANFVMLFPAIFLMLPLRSIFRRDQALIVLLLAYCIFLYAWISMPLPSVVRAAISATGWYLSPSGRSVLGLGVTSILLITIVASRVADGTIATRKCIFPILAIAAIIVVSYGIYLREFDPKFFNTRRIFLALTSSMLIIYATVKSKKYLFMLGVLIIVFDPMRANPLISGLDSILKKPILVAAEGATVNPGDRWLVVGSMVFSQGLKAHGLNVVSGSEYYPDTDTINALDPLRHSTHVWNRYAHISFASVPGTVNPVLKLAQLDAYIATIDVCGDVPIKLGVTLIAYTGAVPAADHHCLIPLRGDPTSPVSLFRMKS